MGLVEKYKTLADRPIAGEGFRFALASILSASVTMVMPVILHVLFRVDPKIAVAIALGTALVVNFLTVRLFVFRSTSPFGRQAAAFALSSIVFRVLEYGAFFALFEFLSIHYFVALGSVLLGSFVAKFAFHRRYVFLK